MAKTFQLDIVTPQGKVFNGTTEMVTLPGISGPFQVLYNHAPLLTQLEIGDIKVLDDNNKELHFATSGGFVEVKQNTVTVLAETVESAQQIEIKRAEAAAKRAMEHIRKGRAKSEEIDMARAEAALSRATNRLKVAEYK